MDAHSSDGFPFKRLRGDFPYLYSPSYDALYELKGWDRHRLPQTDFEPLFGNGEAAKAMISIGVKLAKAKPGSLFGIEAADFILSADDAQRLVYLKKKHGIALKVQLTYNHQNQLATGCRTWDMERNQYSGMGLSALGKEVAEIFMQGGIVIDVSHLGKQSLLDACAIGKRLKKPVIASHSNALDVFAQGMASKAKHRLAARCLEDREIFAVLETGGYVGLTFSPWFLGIIGAELMAEANGNGKLGNLLRQSIGKKARKEAIELLMQHINHVRNVARQSGLDPIKSVALASDAEFSEKSGARIMPLGFSQRAYKGIFSELARELKNSGWKENELAALFHGNVEGVFGLKPF